MESREAPWENGVFNGEGGGIFKSIDRRKNVATINERTTARYRAGKYRNAPSKPSTLFVAVRTKRSLNFIDRMTAAKIRPEQLTIRGRGLGLWRRSPVVRFDPKDPLIVYSASVVCWKSTDGGKNWEGWRGAPGGDDYQNVGSIRTITTSFFLGSDQGAIVT